MKVSNVSVEVGFSSEVREALKQFKAAKEAEAQAKAAKAQAEVILRSALGDSSQATISGAVAFKLVNGSSRHASLKDLAEGFPEAYEAVVKTTPYDYIKSI
jgi:hypothetical protein